MTQPETERDLIEFATEEGDTVVLEVINYFFYEGQEYAMLVDYVEGEEEHVHHEGCDHCDHDHEETGVYLMRVVTTDDQEEFIPLEESEIDPIFDFLESLEEDLEDEEE